MFSVSEQEQFPDPRASLVFGEPAREERTVPNTCAQGTTYRYIWDF